MRITSLPDEDTNEEFFQGTIALGLYTPWFGLYFTADPEPPEPGWMLIVGPFQLWSRRNCGKHLSLIDHPPFWSRA